MAPESKTYFELARAGEDDRRWVWRIRSFEDHAILASSEPLPSRSAAEDAMRLVADSRFAHVWDQTLPDDRRQKWVHLLG